MKVGACIFLTDGSIGPAQLAEELESRGFEALWVPEHSHIPASRLTPWGGRAGAPPLPEEYWRTLDSFVALGAAAAVTDNLILGTGITLVPQRDPIWLAKEVATLDVISGGRFQFGVGYGWNREEMAQHGVSYGERRALMAEQIGLMKALWTQEEASFQGEMLSLEPSWAWPKPVQKPHPPIYMGGSPGPKTFAAMAEFCDGWLPFPSRKLGEQAESLRSALQEAGRDSAGFDIMVFGGKPDPARWAEWEEMGINRMAVWLPPAPAEELIPILDEYRELIPG